MISLREQEKKSSAFDKEIELIKIVIIIGNYRDVEEKRKLIIDI